MSPLQTLRQRAGLTQVELAARLQVTQAAISHYEAGRAIPASLLVRMTDALGCDVADLRPSLPALEQTRGRRRRKKPGTQGEPDACYVQMLTHFRTKAGLNLEGLASQSGIARQVLSKMEAGLLPVETADARTLAQVLSCRPEEIQSPGAGPLESGAALVETHDRGGRPIAGGSITSEERQRARYELGLAESPLLKQPQKTKKPRYPTGAAVESYRRALGITQQELAAKAGISQPAISAIEAGQAPLPRAVWEALAAEFGVHPAALGGAEWNQAL